MAKEDLTKEEAVNSLKKANLWERISELDRGLDYLVGESGKLFSGGEKQRLAIAQTFLKNAPILILDEVIANLDAKNEILISQAINNIKKDKITLIIAHRLSIIKSADKIIFLKDGRVHKSGTYDELYLECSEFKKLLGENKKN